MAGRGEGAWTDPGIKAPDGSAKASGTGGERWDSVGKMLRTDIKTNYVRRMGLA